MRLIGYVYRCDRCGSKMTAELNQTLIHYCKWLPVVDIYHMRDTL